MYHQNVTYIFIINTLMNSKILMASIQNAVITKIISYRNPNNLHWWRYWPVICTTRLTGAGFAAGWGLWRCGGGERRASTLLWRCVLGQPLGQGGVVLRQLLSRRQYCQRTTITISTLNELCQTGIRYVQSSQAARRLHGLAKQTNLCTQVFKPDITIVRPECIFLRR